MKTNMLRPSAAGWVLCVSLAGCAGLDTPNRSVNALNEQAAWASSMGLAARPQAVAAVQGQGGTVRLTGGELSSAPPPALPVAAAPPPVAATPPAATPATATSPSPAAPVPEAVTDSERRLVLNTILAWRKAWVEGDVASYIGAYEAGFKGELASRAAWEKQRRERVAGGNVIVRIENMAVRVMPEEAQAEFTQRYISSRHEDVGYKSMKLRKIGGKWLIVEEKWRKA